MAEEEFANLWNQDWAAIPNLQYIMKYKCDEDGYTLLVTNLATAFGEKFDVKAIQEKFQVLNPHVEMRPEVILKHLKQSLKNTVTGESSVKDEFKVTSDTSRFEILYTLNISGVRCIYKFELRKLDDIQVTVHILRPILLRALALDEEIAALERKHQELEFRQSSFSPTKSNDRKKNMKAIYSEVQDLTAPGVGTMEAFLYLQRKKYMPPKSLENTPSDSSVNHESKNGIQHTEMPELSIKKEKTDDELKDADHQIEEKVQQCVSPLKREMAGDDTKEEGALKPAPNLKPSVPKKKKLIKF